MSDVKKIKAFHVDERGEIAYISDPDMKISNVLYLTFKKGAVRAGHYHKKDVHSIFLISGKLEYTRKPMNVPDAQPETVIVNPGELITTPAMIGHKVVGLEDSLAAVLTTEPRDQSHYEKDTVRIDI